MFEKEFSLQECLDSTFPWLLGLAAFPLLPLEQEEEDEDDLGTDEFLKETKKEKEEKKPDYDVARQDVVKVRLYICAHYVLKSFYQLCLSSLIPLIYFYSCRLALKS